MFLKLISLFLFAAVIPSTGYAAIEIGQIIKDVLVGQKNARLPWQFYAQSGTPIHWQTEGGGNNLRVGDVVLSVNGFVPEVIGKGVEQGKWNVSAVGDNFGISELRLSTEACFGSVAISKKCIPRLEQFPQSLKKFGIESELICKFGPGDSRSEVRRLKLNGSAPIYLITNISGGSGGEFFSFFTIFKGTSYGSELEHSSAVCAFLFQADGGANSIVADDYRHLSK